MTINQKPSKAMVTYPWFVSDRDTKTNKGVVYSLCSTTSAKAVEGAKLSYNIIPATVSELFTYSI